MGTVTKPSSRISTDHRLTRVVLGSRQDILKRRTPDIELQSSESSGDAICMTAVSCLLRGAHASSSSLLGVGGCTSGPGTLRPSLCVQEAVACVMGELQYVQSKVCCG